MKKLKYAVAIALAAIMLLTVCSCGDGDTEDTAAEVVYYTVTFDSVGGTEIPSMRVKKDSKAAVPTEPEREGYIFGYWQLGGREWRFDMDEVTSDITLSAHWIDSSAVYDYAVLSEEKREISIVGVKTLYENVRIPKTINGNTVTAIGDGLFEDTSAEKVKSIVIPDTVTSVGVSAFAGCVGIDIVISGALSSVGERAFAGCDGLKAVTLAEGLSSIPYSAFAGCTSLKEIRLPESVTLISENAFEECEALVSVMLHAGVSTVEDGAFRFCDALTTVYYYGTEQLFDSISVAGKNDSLTDARLCIYSEQKPSEDGDFWYFDGKGKIKLW